MALTKQLPDGKAGGPLVRTPTSQLFHSESLHTAPYHRTIASWNFLGTANQKLFHTPITTIMKESSWSSFRCWMKLNEVVVVRNWWSGIEKWIPGWLTWVKGPLTYLVYCGNRIRFVHLDHINSKRLHPFFEFSGWQQKAVSWACRWSHKKRRLVWFPPCYFQVTFQVLGIVLLRGSERST